MPRHLAPSGAPIRAADLVRWAALMLSARDVHASLREEISARFGVRHAFLTTTGRGGMAVLLGALRHLAPGRDEVLLPSYTCYSVAASVVKAGLRVRLSDISPDTLDYAPDALEAADFSRVLAIVATNLYGLPSDLPRWQRLARRHGVFLIDDAAQAMGAAIEGCWCGTWGDAGLYSFDKGKNVSAIDGGVIVTGSPDVAEVVGRELARVGRPGLAAAAGHAARTLAYFTLLRPWLYGMPARIPQLGLGRTVFTTEFPLERPSRSQAALARVMIDRLDDFAASRAARASALTDGLSRVPGVRPIRALPGSMPAWLRLPVLFDDAPSRDRALEALSAAGLGASGSYPASLADVGALRPHLTDPAPPADAGRLLARRIATLPTHPFVTRADVDRVVAVLTAGMNRVAPEGAAPSSDVARPSLTHVE